MFIVFRLGFQIGARLTTNSYVSPYCLQLRGRVGVCKRQFYYERLLSCISWSLRWHIYVIETWKQWKLYLKLHYIIASHWPCSQFRCFTICRTSLSFKDNNLTYNSNDTHSLLIICRGSNTISSNRQQLIPKSNTILTMKILLLFDNIALIEKNRYIWCWVLHHITVISHDRFGLKHQ